MHKRYGNSKIYFWETSLHLKVRQSHFWPSVTSYLATWAVWLYGWQCQYESLYGKHLSNLKDGLLWNVFCADIHGLQRMKPDDFSEPLTFPLALPWRWHFWFVVKHFDNYWVDCHDIGCTHSCFPEVIPSLFSFPVVKISLCPILWLLTKCLQMNGISISLSHTWFLR